MRNFFVCTNNGVTAIVAEGVYRDIQKYGEISLYFYKWDEEEKVPYEKRWKQSMANKATLHLCMPVFTFTRQATCAQSPWFTGNEKLLEALIEHIQDNGGRVGSEHFHVPFSNGFELGVHGQDLMESELRHVTTNQQFFETFGVRIKDLLPK